MRFFLIAATVVLMAMPAHAAGMGGGKRRQGSDQNTQQQKNKVDEKAYQSALDKLPDQKEKYDPWQNMREKPKSK